MSQRIREGRVVSVFTRLSCAVCPSGCRIIQSQGAIGQPGCPPVRGTEEGMGPDDLPVLAQRAPSEEWGGSGQVPFLLAERAR